ncbi:MAG: hypothetical protein CMM50_09725 [Rhodospirillaceae bacterium]|mgnify:CR=1 FL=1|nr:hypothetical protein [Rhodospirillaceae bacterium]
MKAAIAAAVITIGLTTSPMAADLEQSIADSRAAIKEFAGTLKEALQTAMREGGPVAAISVCNTQAPEIAAAASANHDLDVGRTSLKLRNPANAPDAWEKGVLLSFEKRLEAGQDPATIDQAEIVTENGKKVFRYMKAIPTAGLCLACHGTDIAPEVTAKLDELYPEDQARGFSIGDIRGAFTIRRPL